MTLTTHSVLRWLKCHEPLLCMFRATSADHMLEKTFTTSRSCVSSEIFMEFMTENFLGLAGTGSRQDPRCGLQDDSCLGPASDICGISGVVGFRGVQLSAPVGFHSFALLPANPTVLAEWQGPSHGNMVGFSNATHA